MNIFYRKIISKGIVKSILQYIRASLIEPVIYKKFVKKIINLPTRKERFTEIYESNFWGSRESKSGVGSEIINTSNIRKNLLNIFSKYKIKSIVDAPCGDFNWMKELKFRKSINYTGVDIVDKMINKNNNLYSNKKNINFIVADICRDKIPDCDLLFVRDFLFHLSFENIDKFLTNIFNTKYKFLLTTTYCNTGQIKNKNIKTGDFRIIDIFSEPFFFNIDELLEQFDDTPMGENFRRRMVLISKNSVPQSLNNSQ